MTIIKSTITSYGRSIPKSIEQYVRAIMTKFNKKQAKTTMDSVESLARLLLMQSGYNKCITHIKNVENNIEHLSDCQNDINFLFAISELDKAGNLLRELKKFAKRTKSVDLDHDVVIFLGGTEYLTIEDVCRMIPNIIETYNLDSTFMDEAMKASPKYMSMVRPMTPPPSATVVYPMQPPYQPPNPAPPQYYVSYPQQPPNPYL